MNDTEFLAALEQCTLEERSFGHAAHVRAAYLYLRSSEFETALVRMRGALRRYVTVLGKANRYHETITVASLALIRQRLFERGDGGDWPGFALQNPDLLDRNFLLRFYPKAQLESELSREIFLLPYAQETDPSCGYR
jgi:hypothetical protein